MRGLPPPPCPRRRAVAVAGRSPVSAPAGTPGHGGAGGSYVAAGPLGPGSISPTPNGGGCDYSPGGRRVRLPLPSTLLGGRDSRDLTSRWCCWPRRRLEQAFGALLGLLGGARSDAALTPRVRSRCSPTTSTPPARSSRRPGRSASCAGTAGSSHDRRVPDDRAPTGRRRGRPARRLDLDAACSAEPPPQARADDDPVRAAVPGIDPADLEALVDVFDRARGRRRRVGRLAHGGRRRGAGTGSPGTRRG